MERWLTPWRTSTYKRPFTWEGNYLVELCGEAALCDVWNNYKQVLNYLRLLITTKVLANFNDTATATDTANVMYCLFFFI